MKQEQKKGESAKKISRGDKEGKTQGGRSWIKVRGVWSSHFLRLKITTPLLPLQ